MGRIPFIFHRQKSVNVLIGRFGLGNRILAMGCALNLAAELNYRLVVYWRADKEVGKTRFDDLFETTALPFELVEGYEAQVMVSAIYSSSEWFKSPKREIWRFLRSLLLSQYDKKIKLHESKGNYDADLSNYRKILLSANDLFRYDCDTTWLKPLPHITAQIVELNEQFAPNTMGVHFRGTDLPYVPPLEKIISRMRAEVELDPGVKFFLASDGDVRGKMMQDLFGDRLITNTIQDARKTVRGHEGAVVDLFGLASTSRIIGPRYSTFSLLASILGNKPLLRIKRAQ